MYTNLYVSNLDFNITSADLKKLFTNYGDVGSCKIVQDKVTQLSKGFAFVTIAENYAENAIQHLNGYSINGKKIKVVYAWTPRSDDN